MTAVYANYRRKLEKLVITPGISEVPTKTMLLLASNILEKSLEGWTRKSARKTRFIEVVLFLRELADSRESTPDDFEGAGI